VLPEVCARPRPRGSSSSPRLARRDRRATRRHNITLAPPRRRAPIVHMATATQTPKAVGTAKCKALAACPRTRCRMRPSARFHSRTSFAAVRLRALPPRTTNTNLQPSRGSDRQPMCRCPFVPSRHRQMRRQSLSERGVLWILHLLRRTARPPCQGVSRTRLWIYYPYTDRLCF
jgi:hypothetical protein